ncbi:hypothetical protein Cgig2_028595 [Carnegiea gigantea]|uniref:FAR1 domain-containing protein n=1 Tax=Carnegiea gigantea TaxID=171969 RepID=A0A9Q1K7B7_9CARY|nr:hypothetical protein Cgig2_028595 [Carnegiea gigantea]
MQPPSPFPFSQLPETLMDCIMETEEGEYQTPKKCKSPTYIIKVWIPFCEEELKPREGLEFANLEECEKFYKSYTHHVGFSVHKSRSKKTKEGSHKYKYYVCSKQGFRQTSTNVNTNRKVKLTREGCNAMVDFWDCMQVSGRDPERLTLDSKGIQNVLNEVKDLNGNTSESKMSELESFIRSSAPDQIDILSPKQCNTKGSDKRIKGGKKKAIEPQGKRLRLYKACGQ